MLVVPCIQALVLQVLEHRR